MLVRMLATACGPDIPALLEGEQVEVDTEFGKRLIAAEAAVELNRHGEPVTSKATKRTPAAAKNAADPND